jgi:predicted esterase
MRTRLRCPISFPAALAAALILTPIQPGRAAQPSPLEPSDAQRKQDFLKLIRKPVLPLAARVETLPRERDLAVEQFWFSSDATHQIDALAYKPANASGRLPVVILLHGTGGRKESMEPLAQEFAKAGLLAVSMDGRYHGAQYGPENGTPLYFKAMVDAYRTGAEHPFLFDSVWDIMRLIDYLETRPDADSSRIGLIGLSKGGMEGWLAAAVDPRIHAVVPLISVQSFRYEVEHNAWQARIGSIGPAVSAAAEAAGIAKIDAEFARRFLDRVAPGLTSEFDGPAMLPLIAPRAMLAVNGEVDPRNPLASALNCAEILRAAYAKAGKPENFDMIVEKGVAHAVTPEAMDQARTWLIRQLTTGTASSRAKSAGTQ